MTRQQFKMVYQTMVLRNSYQYAIFLFKDTSKSTFLGLSLHLFLFTICPHKLKTRSEDTEDPGMDRYFLAILLILGKKHSCFFHHSRTLRGPGLLPQSLFQDTFAIRFQQLTLSLLHSVLYKLHHPAIPLYLLI